VESSVYAASDDAKQVTVVLINKTNASRRFGIRVQDTIRLADVDVYAIDSAHAKPHVVAHEALTKTNAYAYSAPAMSAALLVFRGR
jgi:methenyltetrahydromethanopterin cyclohydrolase